MGGGNPSPPTYVAIERRVPSSVKALQANTVVLMGLNKSEVIIIKKIYVYIKMILIL